MGGKPDRPAGRRPAEAHDRDPVAAAGMPRQETDGTTRRRHAGVEELRSRRRAAKTSPVPWVSALLRWYRTQGRKLPWRETRDPYRIWISEIMLQQTRVDTVIPYYRRFLEAYPAADALARAPREDVLKLWENLGYYSRARHLHKAAQIIRAEHGGSLPEEWESLRRLPGIGAYTAGAILSIAHGKVLPALDGNVRRVLCRLYALNLPPNRSDSQKALDHLARRLIPPDDPGGFNQALMDLGATICAPRGPRCPQCPVSGSCRARRKGKQDLFPATVRRPATPTREAVAAVIRNADDRILVVQRPAEGLLASLWTLPGGFRRPDESPEEALRRRCREMLDARIQPGQYLGRIHHAYTHFRLVLDVYRSDMTGKRIRCLTCQDRRWADGEELSRLAFSRADRKAIALLPPTAG